MILHPTIDTSQQTGKGLHIGLTLNNQDTLLEKKKLEHKPCSLLNTINISIFAKASRDYLQICF
jgi:hypothetical protein